MSRADKGLMFYRARWYDPVLGRFNSEDPIDFSGGANWYTYVGNNPMGYTDPLGPTWEEAVQYLPQYFSWIGAAAAIGATIAALWYGAYLTGDWFAHRPWNPFVNGPLNPFGDPNPPHLPLPDLSKCNMPRATPMPFPLSTPHVPPLGPNHPPRDPDKEIECWEKCGHLLQSPSGDRQSSEFRKCYRECMGTL